MIQAWNTVDVLSTGVHFPNRLLPLASPGFDRPESQATHNQSHRQDRIPFEV